MFQCSTPHHCRVSFHSVKDSSSAGAHTGASSDQDPDTGDRGDRGYREDRDRRYREHRDRGYREDKDRGYREDKDRVYREDKDRGYREEADRGYREDLDSRGEGDSREERELTSSSLPTPPPPPLQVQEHVSCLFRVPQFSSLHMSTQWLSCAKIRRIFVSHSFKVVVSTGGIL